MYIYTYVYIFLFFMNQSYMSYGPTYPSNRTSSDSRGAACQWRSLGRVLFLSVSWHHGDAATVVV